MYQKDIKVSFIVPAYNVEKYIKQCIDSLLNQSLKEIEVIVVNDGSTDNTLEILHSYDDKRLIVITKENEGASAARNDGIKAARAKFIINIDADDFVDEDYAKDTFSMANEFGADVVVTDMFRDFGKHKKYITDYKIKDGLLNKELYFKKMILSKGVCHNAVNKLIKTDLLKSNPFPEGIFLGDDLNTTPKVIYNADKIVKINKAYYHYRTGENNTSGFESLRGIKDHKFVYDDLINFCNQNVKKDKKELISALEHRKIKGVYMPLISSRPDPNNQNYVAGLKILKDDMEWILNSAGFKKLRFKYKVLFYIIKSIKNDETLCKIFYRFNKINNFFSGKNMKEFKA